MKKSLFYWAFLAFVGISLTACSSDDSITDNEKPVIPNSNNNEVILTGTIGIGSDGTTRSISDAGEKSWTVGDEICVQYETSSGSYAKAKGRITEGGGTQKAKFTATLVNPKNDGNIGFAYPYDKVTANGGSATNFTFNYDAYNNQDGTTSGITSSGLDYACSESAVLMKVNGTKAELKTDAPLENQFCMYKFTIADSKTATLLEIIIANTDNFTTPKKNYYVKPASAANVFYVALEPKETGDKVKVVASIADASGVTGAMKLDSEYKINQISASDYGKFICVDATDGNQAYLCSTSTNPTTATVCEHTYGTTTIFVKDKFYKATLLTSTKNLTPTAVIAHVGAVSGYCGKFIALALEDVYSETKTVAQARQLIGQENNWVVQHKMKIINATYDYLAGSTTTGDEGKYDVVQDNELYKDDPSASNYKQMKTDHPSQQTGLTLIKGWRIPTVTDFRYIFQDLKTGSPAVPVINQSLITATTPQGIGDQDTFYYDGQNTETGGTGGTAKYGTGNSALYNHINHLCGNYLLQNTYYWLSSQVKDTEGNPKDNKAWRFSFSADQFEWNEADDQSLARLVFAY